MLPVCAFLIDSDPTEADQARDRDDVIGVRRLPHAEDERQCDDREQPGHVVGVVRGVVGVASPPATASSEIEPRIHLRGCP
jgi:hypothetical protein